MLDHNKGYNGNEKLKKENVKIEWTPDIMQEYIKCANDPIYWAEKYVKISHVDHGIINITLYDFQKEIIQASKDSRRTIVCTGRQQGKCYTFTTFIRIRSKANGEIFEMMAGVFHEWFSFKKYVESIVSNLK